jgi:hypothetical protein
LTRSRASVEWIFNQCGGKALPGERVVLGLVHEGGELGKLRTLYVGGVEPDEEGFDIVVDLRALPADPALRDACTAHGPDQVVDRAGRTPWT